MSHSLASRLVHFERASIAYLVVAYFVMAGLLGTQWVRAVAAMGDGIGASPDDRALELGGTP
jgi:hypothetical protein